jgi:serine/threonine-protein kinase
LQTIGKYQVEKVLGRGGMGTVYQAHDPVIHRKVALKTMMPGFAETPELKARFLREAQAAGGLRHRNIVTVYDLGEDKGQPYIAMEFIEGVDLEKVIQAREPVTVEWKIDVIRQVCEGLGHAHRSGIVHRDVKPANIRVTPEGEVKIMDFGIAHLQSSKMTKGGLVLGTVHYMAPEQVDGHKVDHRADIFSVGAIAFELLAYRRPFDADSLTAIMLRIVRDAPDLTAIPRSAYSPGLERIVARALAKPLDQRYQTLEQMRDDLERLVRETAARIETSPAASAPAARSAPPSEAPTAEADRRQAQAQAESAEIQAAIAEARRQGQLQKALSLCRRLADRGIDEPAARRLTAEVEDAIRDKETEQLSGLALGYAVDGDLELAAKIASRLERLAPGGARHRELVAYLEEERARRAATALIGAAREHIALGNLEEARATAEEVLRTQPGHALAREIRDRVAGVLAQRERSTAGAAPVAEPEAPAPEAAAPETAAPDTLPPETGASETPASETAPPPSAEAALPLMVEPSPAVVASPPPESLTPLPEGPPADAETARLLEEARRHLKARDPLKALPLLEEAVVRDPGHATIARLLASARLEARKAEAAALTTAGLNSFLQNDHARARRAVEKALALDPGNRRAQELLDVLGVLG